jgi:SAM-dependent methyltransferase
MNSTFNELQFVLLKRFVDLSPSTYQGVPHRRPLQSCFDATFPARVKDAVVIDFGSGHGSDTIEMSLMGAERAIGIELRESLVEQCRNKTNLYNCDFYTKLPNELRSKADLVISVDAFEHFEDPALILNHMYDTLKPGGLAMISFGPPWRHPRGGHLFSVFPWAHLILSEASLIKWRNLFIHDGAKRFEEVEGGLNRMTVKSFAKYVENSPFEMVTMNCVAIRGFSLFQKLLSREFFTSCVQATLKKPS